MATDKAKGAAAQVGWPHAVRDVFIAAINRGQLPALLFGLVLLLLVWKLPETETGPIFNRILTRLEDGSVLGWALAAALAFGWFLHARNMRERFGAALQQLQGGEKPPAIKGGGS